MNLNEQNLNTVSDSNEQLQIYITDVVQEIILMVAESDNLLEQDKFEQLITRIDNILDDFNLTLEQVVPEQVLLNFFGGFDEATILLAETGMKVNNALAIGAGGQIAKGFQRKINTEAVGAIVDDTLMDLNAAIRTAKGNVKASLGGAIESVKADISKGLISGDNNNVISKKVMDSFAKNGMTSFVTKDGKQLPLDFYARTVAKTKMKQSTTLGNISRYTDSGVGLVKVTSSYPTCYKCANYTGMVISLTGEHPGFKSTGSTEVPPYHPHCECSLSPYVLEYKDEKDIEAEKEKWNKFDEDEDTRSRNQQKEYSKQQKIRQQANAEKKQFAKYQAALGAEAPKTLGAFRRMKRQNTPKFQELQSQYRSIAQQASS